MPKRRDVLTKEQARNILENPVETGYTYAESLTYRRKGQEQYVHPRMGRRPIRFSVPDDNFGHSVSEIQRTDSVLASLLDSRSSSSSKSSSSGSSLSRSTSDRVDSSSGNDVEIVEERQSGRNVASAEAYEGLLKKAWNTVPNGDVLQWSTSQAGGRGVQRTMRYAMSSEEHGDKWWMNKSVDETTEYLGSAPGATSAEGVRTNTFVGGAHSSANFAANSYSSRDYRGSSGGGILKSSGSYTSSGKDYEVRKSFTASLCTACCWLLLLLLLLGLLSAILTTNCSKCEDGDECNTTSAETWTPSLDDRVDTDDLWLPEPSGKTEAKRPPEETLTSGG